MPGEVNCIFTKVLLPFVEKEVGPEGVAAILRTAGRSRDYLVADHNWVPLPLFNELVRLAMDLMGETDEERWTRRFTEYLMEWRPSRSDRHYLGTYSMALAEPRRYVERCTTIWGHNQRFLRLELVDIGRRQARLQWRRGSGEPMPQWSCTLTKVGLERAPTVWWLPPATVAEPGARGARGAGVCARAAGASPAARPAVLDRDARWRGGFDSARGGAGHDARGVVGPRRAGRGRAGVGRPRDRRDAARARAPA